MLWSSRKVLNTDKGLRCPILIVHQSQAAYECNRPAKMYAQSVCRRDQFGKYLVFDLGNARLCKGHAKQCEAQGITLMQIDRRRKVTAGAQGDGE